MIFLVGGYARVNHPSPKAKHVYKIQKEMNMKALEKLKETNVSQT